MAVSASRNCQGVLLTRQIDDLAAETATWANSSILVSKQKRTPRPCLDRIASIVIIEAIDCIDMIDLSYTNCL
jgi:hypothetical protein